MQVLCRYTDICVVLTLGLPCLLIYLSLGYAWRVFAFVLCSCFIFSPPLRSDRGRLSRLLLFPLLLFFHTTLCRYINYKWVSINISYICHVEHHMTPAIDKRGIITYSYHKERTKKKKKSEFTGDGRLPSPILSYTEI